MFGSIDGPWPIISSFMLLTKKKYDSQPMYLLLQFYMLGHKKLFFGNTACVVIKNVLICPIDSKTPL